MKYPLSLLGFFIIFFSGCSALKKPSYIVHKIPIHCKELYDMKQAKCIDEKTFIKRLKPYRIIFFGDHHN